MKMDEIWGLQSGSTGDLLREGRTDCVAAFTCCTSAREYLRVLTNRNYTPVCLLSREIVVRRFAKMFCELPGQAQSCAMNILNAWDITGRTEHVDRLVAIFDPPPPAPPLLIEDDDSPYFEGWKCCVIIRLNTHGIRTPQDLVKAGFTEQDAKDAAWGQRALSPHGIKLVAAHLGCEPTDIDPGYEEVPSE